MPSRRLLLPLVATLVLTLLPSAPAFATPWFTESFSTGTSDVFDGFGWRATSDGQAGAGIRTPIAKGSHYGASEHVDLAAIGQHEREELYWRYWLRLDPNFTMEQGDRGKLPGPAALSRSGCRGGTTSTPSSPCWSARMMFRSDRRFDSDHIDYIGQRDRALLGTYVYHLDGPEGRGDELMWGVDGRIRAGRWYCVEGRVRLNTSGARNGVLQQWLDGKQVLDRRDLRFRRASEGDLDVRSMWMNVYYGFGTGSNSVTSPAAQGVSADSLVLGPSRIGCGATFDVRFTDHRASVHRADIEWLAKRSITRGCDPPTNRRYCPSQSVTRAQMATFLVRALDLPASEHDRFEDDDTSVHEADVQALAAAGITRGCNPPANTRFCPDDPVTRGEMAAFIKRAWNLPDGSHSFTDVAKSPFRGDIGAIARADITKGCNPPDNDRYCPWRTVTREQMASFLRRASIRPQG